MYETGQSKENHVFFNDSWKIAGRRGYRFRTLRGLCRPNSIRRELLKDVKHFEHAKAQLDIRDPKTVVSYTAVNKG